MENDDWLDAPPAESPELNMPVAVALPSDFRARLALVETCLARLTDKQRLFLAAYRECNGNALAASRMLRGQVSRTSHNNWAASNRDYATVLRAWTHVTAESALDRDRLLARQEYIIEEALTPKPILHQGAPTGFEEINLGVAARANEVLLDRVVPKPRDSVEVNVGVAFNPVQVEIEEPAGATLDASAEVVEAGPVLPA
jgi:hypothetical protein